MQTGMQLLEQRAADAGIALGNNIPVEVFAELGLPFIVRCTGCDETMALGQAVIDDGGQIYCDDCLCQCGVGDCDVHQVEYIEPAKSNTLTDLLYGDGDDCPF